MKNIRRSVPWLLLAVALLVGGLWAGSGVYAALSAAGPSTPVPGTTPAVSFPAWYKDSNGLALSLCLDGPPHCLASTADLDPANPAASGEAFYWSAEIAGMPVGSGTALLVLAQEAAFSNENPQVGAEAVFGRIRIRLSGLTPNTDYVITHPYGQKTVTTEADGSATDTQDVGCFPQPGTPPCDHNAFVGANPLGPFLVWDPAVAPAAPAGYIGSASTPHKVIGSPTGNNFFRVQGPEGTFTSDLFSVEGKKALDAVDDTATVPANAVGVPLNVLANDTASSSDTITVDSVTQPTNGSSTDANTHVTYTNNGTAGADSFTYTATNGVVTDTATVNITAHAVNAAPVAVADAITVTINSISNAMDVLANDTDADNDVKFVSAVTQPTNGTAAVGTAGLNVLYTPTAGFAGADSFTYTLSDGVGTSTVTVTVTINRAPTPVDDTAIVTANTSNNAIDVLANDTDPDGNALTVTAVTQGSSGTAAVAPGGTGVLYTPQTNFGGTVPFTYTVSDGAITATARVTVTVNRFPIAATDAITVALDSANNALNVLANDSDPDGNTITVTAVGQPAKGAASPGPGGLNIIYSPNVGISGTDPFTYTISDGLLTATSTVTVTINRAPVAVDDTARAPQNSITNTITVLANDSDPDGNTLTVTGVTQPANGTASVGAGGLDVRYAPRTAFVGADTFTYTLSDGHMTATGTVTVTVHRGPQAGNDTFTVLRNSVDNALNVLANDRDPDGDAIFVSDVTQGANGNVVLGTNGVNVVYTPRPDFTGTDTFEYTVSDGQVTDTGTVTVNVNQAPVAANDTVSVLRNSQGNPINVLANDSDPNGDALTVVFVTQPSNGSASVGSAGLNVTYSPDAGFFGTDTFSYTISDGSLSATGSVTVNIPDQRVSNSAPAAVNDLAVVARNSSGNVLNVLSNDSDPDNDSIRIIAVGSATNGVVSVALGGSVVLYSPNQGFSGSDSFTYSISDGLLSATGTVNVNVPVNSAPVASNDSLTVPKDSSNNPMPVLGNDTDGDNDQLTITAVGSASNGSVSIGPGGTAVIYTPNPGFAGTDSFIYTVSDGALSSSATASIIVHALNTAPVSLGDTATVGVDSANNPIGVLANDSDPDGDPVAVDSVTQGSNGSVTISADRSRVRYTPAAGFKGTDTFTYTITDGALFSSPTVVTVTVSGVRIFIPLLAHLDTLGW